MKLKLNKREIKILTVVIAVWGVFLVISGITMNLNKKTVNKVNYRLDVSNKKIASAQAKKIEIILKDVEVEINNPISVNVKDYLKDGDKIDEKIIKQLELDTSLVNISQAGSYKYTITYNKDRQNRVELIVE